MEFLEGLEVTKKHGHKESFDLGKIRTAIEKSFISVYGHKGLIEHKEGVEVAVSGVVKTLRHLTKFSPNTEITVDLVHDLVEDSLMDINHLVAKEYILYRSHRKEAKQRNLLIPRANVFPSEYPEFEEFENAITHSFWRHTEYNYDSDVHYFNHVLTPHQKTVISRAMLAISQIEVSIKSKWAMLYAKLPKPEVLLVGSVFAESEARHLRAYSELLRRLNLFDEFEGLSEVEVFKKRLKRLQNADDAFNHQVEAIIYDIATFAVLVEGASLFSQFLLIMSFEKYQNMLKGMSNAVAATSLEEEVHKRFGIQLVNLLIEENPRIEVDKVKAAVREKVIAFMREEKELIDWIFEGGHFIYLQ